MHVYCSYSGGVPRASSSSPLRTIGPAQSAEGEWPGEGGGAGARSQWLGKRANEGGTVLNLPGEKLNLSAWISAIFGSKRGCLHIESAIFGSQTGSYMSHLK